MMASVCKYIACLCMYVTRQDIHKAIHLDGRSVMYPTLTGISLMTDNIASHSPDLITSSPSRHKRVHLGAIPPGEKPRAMTIEYYTDDNFHRRSPPLV